MLRRASSRHLLKQKYCGDVKDLCDIALTCVGDRIHLLISNSFIELNMSESKPDPKPDARIGRRQFLIAGSGLAAALSAPGWAQAQTAPVPGGSEPTGGNPPAPPSPDLKPLKKFQEPTAIASRQGVATVDLRLESVVFNYEIAAGSTPVSVCTRSYNGLIPGPTVMLDAGDRVELQLSNTLVGDGPEAKLNAPNMFNTTNIHFHGLHVSPRSYGKDGESTLSSDDVLYELHPRDSVDKPIPSHQWCVWLPDFHAPGTHWYHSHCHGSTGVQVSNGMAGAIIVREPEPVLNMVGETEDKVWLLQEIRQPDKPLTQCPAVLNDKLDFTEDSQVYQGAGTWNFLVNGLYQPMVTIKAGQNQRWRFINATSTPRGLMTLKLARANGPDDINAKVAESDLVDLYLIAVDGISFYGKPPEPIGPSNQRSPQRLSWELAPGNRADFLVNLPAGYYKVIKDYGGGQGKTLKGELSPQVLAIVEVQASVFNEKIPARVPGFLERFPYLKPIATEELRKNDAGQILNRNVVFSTAKAVGAGNYKVNQSIYAPDCANIQVNLGSCEEWTLTTQEGAFHPFHIHVNPFQLVGDKIDPEGPDDPSNWRWWDTIAVPRNQILRIRNRFADFAGGFVIHCHILIHEDQGMMMNVVVQETDQEKGALPGWSLDWQGNSQPSPLVVKAIANGATLMPLPSQTRGCTLVELVPPPVAGLDAPTQA